MKQVLIIPDRNNMEEALRLAKQYDLGFEYNDFFMPDILDNEEKIKEILDAYHTQAIPSYCTVHGAFFDVIPFSMDAKIREIANLRIEQSIAVAKRIGAKAVVFHTNYDPFLNTEAYITSWIEKNVSYWSDVLTRHKDINIYLENMFDTTPDIMEALSEKLSCYENYGVCLDYAHAFLSKTAPEIWAKRLGRFVKHIHINDNDGISDLHLAWGDGKIDRQKFYECYEAYMKGATVLIETSTEERRERSIKVLEEEGFLNNKLEE